MSGDRHDFFIVVVYFNIFLHSYTVSGTMNKKFSSMSIIFKFQDEREGGKKRGKEEES